MSVCNPPPPPFQPNFQKKKGGRGLTGSQFLEGGCWDRGGDFSEGGVAVFT